MRARDEHYDKRAIRILSRSPRLAPSLGATAPIPPNGVPSEHSVARHGSLLRWGLLPPYPRLECPPNTQSLAKARSFVGGYCPHTPAKKAIPILVCSTGLAPALGATAPIPRMECPPNTQSLAKARSFVGGFRPHTPAKKALPILSRSPSLAPSLGASAPIPLLLFGCVGYAIVASRQSKSLSRGLCPYPPNRGAHYRYTLKKRLPETCCLSPLRQVYVVRLSGTDGKRNHNHYRYADPWNGSLLFVATIQDLGSLPRGQATQNPVATEASIPWHCFTFRGVVALSVRLAFINVVEVELRKHLPRGA